MSLMRRMYQKFWVYSLSLALALGGAWPLTAQAERGARNDPPRTERRQQHQRPQHERYSRHRYTPAPRVEVRRPHYRAPLRNHHYDYRPAHSYRYNHLPLGALLLTLGGLAYYYHSGLFYQPMDSGYAVVNAPMGAVVPSLPSGYRIVLLGGQVYYVVGDTYYLQSPQGYMVTARPGLDLSTQPNSYNYPSGTQGTEQQARDRYECHRWGVDQSGFDPSLGASGGGMQDSYYRAMNACLAGRGYATR